MDDQNKNLILATALSFLVIMTWFVLFPPPEPPVDPNEPATAESADAPGSVATPTADAADDTAAATASGTPDNG